MFFYSIWLRTANEQFYDFMMRKLKFTSANNKLGFHLAFFLLGAVVDITRRTSLLIRIRLRA